MDSSSGLPWAKIHEFLLNVGDVREPKEFGIQVVKRIYRLIPYDQARVYFINDSGNICDEFLVGVEQFWSNAYREYFSRIDGGRYAIPNRRHWVPAGKVKGRYRYLTAIMFQYPLRIEW